MPVVSAIERQKQRADRYSIFVDNAYSFSLSDLDLSLSGLSVGQELTPSEVEQYTQKSAAGKAHEAALRYLSYRHRSQGEMTTYLKRKGYANEGAEVIERLQREGLLSDASFAGHWIADRQVLKPRSRLKLESELRAKGLDGATIEEALAAVSPEDELAAARSLIQKKRTLASYQDPLKLQRYLASQGFSWATIRRALGDD